MTSQGRHTCTIKVFSLLFLILKKLEFENLKSERFEKRTLKTIFFMLKRHESEEFKIKEIVSYVLYVSHH